MTLHSRKNDKGQPALNELGDVTAIVQKFMSDTLSDYHKFGLGKVPRDEAMASIRARATATGRIFMGKDPAYYATEWNAPHRLGAHIRAAVKFEDPNQDPGEAFFVWLSTQAVHAANDLQSGTWAEQVGRQIQGVTQSAVKFLLTGAG